MSIILEQIAIYTYIFVSLFVLLVKRTLNLFSFSIISKNWIDTGIQDLSSRKANDHRSYICNIIGDLFYVDHRKLTSRMDKMLVKQQTTI